MTRLCKALPLVLALLAAFTALPLAAQGTPTDCSFTVAFTTDTTGNGVANLSQNTPCVNWRITFSTAGGMTVTAVTFQTSPDNSTWASVPNTACSSTVQPPCLLAGTNPLTGTTQGMSYFSAYGAYVRVIITGTNSTGSGTVRGYGAKGASASGGGGGSGGGGASPLIFAATTPAGACTSGTDANVQNTTSGAQFACVGNTWVQIIAQDQSTAQFFFTDQVSDISGDLQATLSPEAAATMLTYGPIASGPDVLQYWATVPASPGVSFFPAGAWTQHIYTRRSGTAGTVTLHTIFVEVSAIGTDLAVIGQTDESAPLTTTAHAYTLVFNNPINYFPTDSTSRIVARTFSTATGANPSIDVFVGGSVDTSIIIPAPTPATMQFSATNPIGTCVSGQPNVQNTLTAAQFTCVGGTWVQIVAAGSGQLVYYQTNTASSIATYLQSTPTPYSPKTTLTFTSLATGATTLQNWATNAGVPFLTFIPAGFFTEHVDALQSGAGTDSVTLHAEIWEVSTTGVDIAMIGQTEESAALLVTEVPYILQFSRFSPYTMGSTASRIVTRIVATVSGTSAPTVQIFVGGTADTHTSLPANNADVTKFVPYTGATTNVNLGGHTLSSGVAGGTAGALSLVGSTSGSATIQAVAAQGTPNAIQFPIATGAASTVLTTDGANPQQTSWTGPYVPYTGATTNVNLGGHTLSSGVAGGTAGAYTWVGSTSGSATVQAPAAQGTPNPIQLPVATGAAGTFLKTDGANPQQTSWGTPGLSAYPTVTDAAPIAWNLGSAVITNGIVTLDHTTATRALNVSNIVNGGFYTLIVKQDATGGALMTLGTGCTWKVVNGGAGAIVLSSAASAIDALTFTYDGTNCYALVQSNFN